MKANTVLIVLGVIAAVLIIAAILLPCLAKGREVCYHSGWNRSLDFVFDVVGPSITVVVVAGTIEGVIPHKDRQIAEMGFRDSITFRVSAVIQGEESYKGAVLKLPVSHFRWPETLVPMTEGAYCALVMWKASSSVKLPEWVSPEGLQIKTVVPTEMREFPVCETPDAAKEMLKKEVLAALKDEKSPERRRDLAEILDPQN